MLGHDQVVGRFESRRLKARIYTNDYSKVAREQTKKNMGFKLSILRYSSIDRKFITGDSMLFVWCPGSLAATMQMMVMTLSKTFKETHGVLHPLFWWYSRKTYVELTHLLTRQITLIWTPARPSYASCAISSRGKRYSIFIQTEKEEHGVFVDKFELLSEAERAKDMEGRLCNFGDFPSEHTTFFRFGSVGQKYDTKYFDREQTSVDAPPVLRPDTYRRP